MLNPIETKGMGKLATRRIHGKEKAFAAPRRIFHDEKRTPHLCQRVRLQSLADRLGQVA
jgi:hypothetical protein